MAKEIGSEFHGMPYESGHGLLLPYCGHMVFSGRTAIETILKNISKAKKAMLPSYCCESMIDPFKRAGISVSFYPVNLKDGKVHIDVETEEDTDILLWCNYFGYRLEMPDFTEFINRGGIVIEDVTHSLFSEQQYHMQSQYLVASIRKWEPINCGGYCARAGSSLRYVPDMTPSDEFIELKRTAMTLKAEYLEDSDQKKKDKFLSMFAKSNHWLSENYSGLTIDQYSKEYLLRADIEKQKRIRRENAAVLYDRLKHKVQFMFPQEDLDCPLFVPVLLEDRDRTRNRLIEKQIYCPVHWPRPNNAVSNLYDTELSLICDQRYGPEDMERICKELTK